MHTSGEVYISVTCFIDKPWPRCDVFSWCSTFILCFEPEPQHPLVSRSAVVSKSLPITSRVPPSYTTPSKLQHGPCCKLLLLFGQPMGTETFHLCPPSYPMTALGWLFVHSVVDDFSLFPTNLTVGVLPFLGSLLLQGVSKWHKHFIMPPLVSPLGECHSLHSGSSLIPHFCSTALLELVVWLGHDIGFD